MKRIYLLKMFVFILGAILLGHGLGLEVISAQELPALGFECKSTTSWAIQDNANLRGLAFDGKYYYAGIYTEGLIRKYDLNGKIVDTIGINDAPHACLGHGVATDGKSVWTSDYSVGRKVYQYNIAENKEVNSWIIPMEGNPTRMAYDGTNLWITVYEVPRVYKVSTEGKLLDSFPVVAGSCWVIGVAVDGEGNIIISDIVAQQLKLFSPKGTLLKTYNFFPGTGEGTTDSSNRGSGLYQVNTSGHIEFYEFSSP